MVGWKDFFALLIFNLYRNFLKSSTELGLYFKLNAIAEKSVMDIVELISAMEEKFGVSAQAAVAVAAAPSAGAASAATRAPSAG